MPNHDYATLVGIIKSVCESGHDVIEGACDRIGPFFRNLILPPRPTCHWTKELRSVWNTPIRAAMGRLAYCLLKLAVSYTHLDVYKRQIQDNAVVHLADDLGAHIGAWCTIGHGAIVHACTIGDGCLIGMGSTVLDGAVIGARSLVGANSLVPQRFQCPPGSLVYGSPARVVRPLTAGEQAESRSLAEKYVEVALALSLIHI